MPAFKLILASLAISLAISAPAAAQSNAASDQYTPCPDRPNVGCTQSLEDGFKTITKNAAKSAEASGNALSGSGTGTTGKDAPAAKENSTTDDSPTTDEAAIGRLPDTGGVSPLVPAAGLLLVATGLLRSRILR